MFEFVSERLLSRRVPREDAAGRTASLCTTLKVQGLKALVQSCIAADSTAGGGGGGGGGGLAAPRPASVERARAVVPLLIKALGANGHLTSAHADVHTRSPTHPAAAFSCVPVVSPSASLNAPVPQRACVRQPCAAAHPADLSGVSSNADSPSPYRLTDNNGSSADSALVRQKAARAAIDLAGRFDSAVSPDLFLRAALTLQDELSGVRGPVREKLLRHLQYKRYGLGLRWTAAAVSPVEGRTFLSSDLPPTAMPQKR